MAKRKSPTVATSAPTPVVAPVPPVTDLRWAIPLGITLITSDPVDPSKRPTKRDIQSREYRYATEVLPALRAALLAAGFNVPDDVVADGAIPVHPNGSPARVIYPPDAEPTSTPTATPTGDGTGVEIVVGPLAEGFDAAPEEPVPAKPAKPVKKRREKPMTRH